MKKIQLTKGEVAAVDDADFRWLSRFNWYCLIAGRGKKYAARRLSRKVGHKTVLMHNVVMRAPAGTIDHKNGDGLDNRRSNLRRHRGQFENMRNQRKRTGSSSYKGVSRSSDGKWVAYITVNYKKKHIGCFDNERAAGLAYDRAALRFHGKFASTNKRLGLL